jgi:hypothetical protein
MCTKPISVNFYKIVSNTVWDSDHASTMRELYIQGVSKNKKIRQFNEIQLAPRQRSVFYSIRVFYSCLKVRFLSAILVAWRKVLIGWAKLAELNWNLWSVSQTDIVLRAKNRQIYFQARQSFEKLNNLIFFIIFMLFLADLNWGIAS